MTTLVERISAVVSAIGTDIGSLENSIDNNQVAIGLILEAQMSILKMQSLLAINLCKRLDAISDADVAKILNEIGA